MNSGKNNLIQPRSIRLEASTVCQLKCPSCPNASGEIARHLGSGFLKFDDFKNIIDRNPWVSHIELSNWGEVFLNRDLIPIMNYAYRNNVALSANNGANLNNVPEEVLEGLVKYKFRAITCSIDGANAETYSIYRVNGNFNQVLNNIRTINKYKTFYQSPYPALKWQLVAFGHNEHEISSARRMAVDLNMEFFLKLSWEDLYGHPFSPIKDAALIRLEAGVGAATRHEYRTKYGKEYALRVCGCSYLWKKPQINYDGRVLGCAVNYWGDYGNAFREGLMEVLNNERIQYARDVVMGKKEIKKGIPCATCPSYLRMKENQSWLTPSEVKEEAISGRRSVRSDKRWLSREPIDQLSQFLGKVKRRLFRRSLPRAGLLISRIGRVSLPLQPDDENGWRPHPIFRGATKGLSDLSCHVSVLNQDRCPHLPHTHKEEELLVLLHGEVDLIFPNTRPPYGNRRQPLKAGQFVYYPSGFSHTLQTVSESPATYLMFKWHAQAKNHKDQLRYGIFNMYGPRENSDLKEGFSSQAIFEGPTSNLEKLQCHTSVLTPGAGYDPHIDPYDVAMIVLEGEVETLGKRVGPYGVIFYASGEPHGIRNPGNTIARYIVFEFHNRKSLLDKGLRRVLRRIRS